MIEYDCRKVKPNLFSVQILSLVRTLYQLILLSRFHGFVVYKFQIPWFLVSLSNFPKIRNVKTHSSHNRLGVVTDVITTPIDFSSSTKRFFPLYLVTWIIQLLESFVRCVEYSL